MLNQKVGIFGGTFDPIHIGHLITTQFVLEHRRLDKIILVPCNISPLKIDQFSSPPVHRMNMLELAIKNISNFSIFDYELKKGEISYTYDTLCEMKKYYESVELIIGYDNLAVFDRWHKPDEIFKLVDVIVMKRHKDKQYKKTHRYFNKAIIIDTPSIDISSSEIRNRVKQNLPIDFLVPDNVKEYISSNKLYQ